MPEVLTQDLRALRAGDRDAEAKVWGTVYDELRRLARQMRRQQGPAARAGAATQSVVHEACLRLLGREIEWRDRRHFFAVAARAMRFVLVDRARRRLARKRDAETTAISTRVADPASADPATVVAVHQALERLAEIHPRQEKLVELHYFAGLTLEETAEVLEVSRRTVLRDWKAVRVWLHGELRTRCQ